MSEIEKLPQGWVKATIDDLADYVNGFAFKPAHWEPTGTPIIRIQNLTNSEKPFNYTKIDVPDIYEVNNGDLLVSWSATLDAFIWRGDKAWLNQHIFKVVPRPNLFHSGLLFYWMKIAIEEMVNTEHLHGSTMKHINRGPFLAHETRLPPIGEQIRIFDKLEELFSELDAGVKELKAAQTKLSQYRQSLLKSAVEGSLTQQWRAENSDQVQETGEQLLTRILKQRREQWQQQKLSEFAEKGKTPPKNWQDKYPEPVQPDTTDLPELPEGWVWASLDMLGDIVSGVTKGTKRKAGIEVREVPYLRVANVQRGFLDLDEVKTIPATESDIKKYTLVPGDILFNEGGDRDKLGRGWVWYGEVKNCIHQNHVFRMRAFVTDLVPEFISHHGNTFGKLWFQSAGKQTTNLASINKGILRKFPVPLAPVMEQNKIIELLEEELTLLAKQEEYTLAALTTSEAQRKNILKSAFSGQLVPQDPNDEPASVLLEKIKQEREALAKKPKPRKPSKPKKKVDLMNTLLEVLTAKNDWIDAQDAFQKCGVVDGTSTDRIEEIYTELRILEKAGKIQIQRQGDFDQLKLIKQDVKED
ncbi:TPA: restriction endonuclease subunit S [Vibrio parahaemolyticus]|uniref:restriction endonuclease subunit S n=2 Tax=Vibrio parahaemolyticus TaxID=670 RepID=UPI0006A599C5|nr:restriction endonuclease subunit S [Vibrio parahaemolyticus]EGQ8730410.1 restriction endonuclease subunit S [Vibrio parahaemolyticus]EGQ8886625.1 restriction endonuclease subunit S [Vibrio parahaemolyticus]EGQ8913100.1 restriction endonuclease subunit S [Vibrio parahaemolyticus]EGQ8932814.1 restriction endonuclease subunit S [Vibrio parahaemolyticus]EGR3279493.1 restriction endonuclease subunit S [Vibrio parahaemolyticus]